MTATVYDDQEQGRFVLETPDGDAYAAYARDGQVLVFTHTYVPRPEQGHGIGKQLLDGAFAVARDEGRKVIAQCPFVANYVEHHPEVRDMVIEG